MKQGKRVNLMNRSSGDILLESVRWCESRGCKFLGYQFRRKLRHDEALLMVYKKESKSGTSIHMFFVFTPLTVVWINEQGRVTHVELARPWRPYYASPDPARYVLETSPGLIDRFSVGDELDIIHI